MLKPGMSVLDVGCGTGAITAGIAKAVGPDGSVVGLDKDASLIAIAREQHANVPNLRFEVADVLTAPIEGVFDIVTGARALQWIHDPALALARMADAAKRPGGAVVVLDYNHASSSWAPDPPSAFHRFYDAFLRWREAKGWINQMGDALPSLFRGAGLREIESSVEDEVTERGDPDWRESAAVMLHIVDTIGHNIVSDGFATEADRIAAEQSFSEWIDASMQTQTLSLRAVAGRKR